MSRQPDPSPQGGNELGAEALRPRTRLIDRASGAGRNRTCSTLKVTGFTDRVPSRSAAAPKTKKAGTLSGPAFESVRLSALSQVTNPRSKHV